MMTRMTAGAIVQPISSVVLPWVCSGSSWPGRCPEPPEHVQQAALGADEDDDGQPEDEDVQILNHARRLGLGHDRGLRHVGTAREQRQQRHAEAEEDQLAS